MVGKETRPIRTNDTVLAADTPVFKVVLMKPDSILPGCGTASTWLDTIEGRQNHLQHGYYCTPPRQPNKYEHNQQFPLAPSLMSEFLFFTSTPPWKRSKHVDRFGTPNLVHGLWSLAMARWDRLRLDPINGNPGLFEISIYADVLLMTGTIEASCFQTNGEVEQCVLWHGGAL